MTTPHPGSMADAHATLRRAEAARTAGRRMISRGERPLYRTEVVRTSPTVDIRIVELPWLTATAPSAREVTAAARVLVASWLDVDPDAFDVGPA